MEEPEDLLRNAEQCAFDLIETIMQNGGDLLYDNYISEKSIPFAVRSTLCVLGSTVEQYYIRHNATEGASWPEETEPSPCSIDTWARNAIPVKRKNPHALCRSNLFRPARRRQVHGKPQFPQIGLGRSLRQGRSLRNPKETASIEETVGASAYSPRQEHRVRRRGNASIQKGARNQAKKRRIRKNEENPRRGGG